MLLHHTEEIRAERGWRDSQTRHLMGTGHWWRRLWATLTPATPTRDDYDLAA